MNERTGIHSVVYSMHVYHQTS